MPRGGVAWIMGDVKRRNNKLQWGYRFQGVDMLNSKHVVSQRAGTINHQRVCRQDVGDFERGGGGRKQVDHRRTEQAEACSLDLLHEPVRRPAVTRYDIFRPRATPFSEHCADPARSEPRTAFVSAQDFIPIMQAFIPR